ncbi:MAG: transglutaminaseTgpA domain-containing protein, partial [Vulcanimicrobiota bacterium]
MRGCLKWMKILFLQFSATGGILLLDEFIKRLKMKKRKPENSIPFRLFTMISVLVSVLAIMHQQEWPLITIPAVLITAAGYYVSYVRRDKKNTLIKVGIALLMMLALLDFFRNLRANPFDPRAPLATLLIWLQAFHSFDLPSRHDLNYSLLVALILMAVASVMAIDSTIIAYYIAFIFACSAALVYQGLSRFNEIAEKNEELEINFVLKKMVTVTLLVIIASMTVYLFIPRYHNFDSPILPRSWVVNLPKISTGGLFNPNNDMSAEEMRNTRGRDLGWNPNNYFGFSPYVHLNYRGKLSDTEIMKVQSSSWSYYRGLVFDNYDGTGWSITGEENGEFEEISKTLPPLKIEPDDKILEKWDETEEIVQIYHVKREMPNIIFGSYQTISLFFPSNTIYLDKNGGIRSPYPLEKGMIYSTISHKIPINSETMRAIEKEHQRLSELKQNGIVEMVDEKDMKYLQLPENVPGRVDSLTRTIIRETVGEDASDYRKALAVSQYLKDTYPYDLEIPYFPDDCDTVDYFLFEQRRGYCEHFATSLAIMLRTQGIPARMVFGYLPGHYDVFSRLYSVKQSDAHSWVEAYVPGYGWMSFDPTPGYSGETFS